MEKNQEILEISKLVFDLTMVGSTVADLDALLERLFGVLRKIPTLRMQSKGAILLFNPRQTLVQVAQYGLRKSANHEFCGLELDGIVPDFIPLAYVTSLRQERGELRHDEQDERFLVLSLYDDERPLGEVIIFIETGWDPQPAELEFMTDVARAISIQVSRHMINETLRVREIELEAARTDAISRLGAASEYRDNETGMHIMRMTNFASAIAKALGLSAEQREILAIAAPMHDVGKIGIADAILLKPGRFTPEEFNLMKKHTEIGAQILKGEDDLIVAAREIAFSHHEHWDGSGYPSGIREDEIPILARVCSIADVFDALTSPRPYKEAWPLQQAIDWIRGESGKKFDPTVVAAFERALPEIQRIRELYRDDIIDPNQITKLPEVKAGKAGWVAWDASLSVGITTIDEHHRYLVDLVNDLHDVVTEKRGAREIARVLKALEQYTHVHFRAEEKMMDHYGFAALDRQRHQHHHFEHKLKEFNDELYANPLTAQFDILTYLRDWLVRHIRHEDAQLRQLVSSAT